jgi:hypothetical protein
LNAFHLWFLLQDGCCGFEDLTHYALYHHQLCGSH